MFITDKSIMFSPREYSDYMSNSFLKGDVVSVDSHSIVGTATSKLLKSHQKLNDGMTCVLMTGPPSMPKAPTRCACNKGFHCNNSCMRKTTTLICSRCMENCVC